MQSQIFILKSIWGLGWMEENYCTYIIIGFVESKSSNTTL